MSVSVSVTVTVAALDDSPQRGGRSGGDAALPGVWAFHCGHRRSHGIGCHLGRSPARAQGQKVSKKKKKNPTAIVSLCFLVCFSTWLQASSCHGCLSGLLTLSKPDQPSVSQADNWDFYFYIFFNQMATVWVVLLLSQMCRLSIITIIIIIIMIIIMIIKLYL